MTFFDKLYVKRLYYQHIFNPASIPDINEVTKSIVI